MGKIYKQIGIYSKKLFLYLPLLFGVSILLMDIIAFLAPILAHFGYKDLAHIIYFVYKFLCHQRPWRSIHLFDYQTAWCTRDTFIYLSMALASFLVVKFNIRKVKWYIPIVVTIPFALDGTIQFIAELSGLLRGDNVFFYASTNFIRMLTGSLFGAGIGIWLFGLLYDTIREEFEFNLKKSKKSNHEISHQNKINPIIFIFIIVIVCFISYIFLVRLWDVTSSKYKPYGLLDHMRYFPGVNYENTGSRGHAI